MSQLQIGMVEKQNERILYFLKNTFLFLQGHVKIRVEVKKLKKKTLKKIRFEVLKRLDII